jgi:hypothetical protein
MNFKEFSPDYSVTHGQRLTLDYTWSTINVRLHRVTSMCTQANGVQPIDYIDEV